MCLNSWLICLPSTGSEAKKLCAQIHNLSIAARVMTFCRQREGRQGLAMFEVKRKKKSRKKQGTLLPTDGNRAQRKTVTESTGSWKGTRRRTRDSSSSSKSSNDSDKVLNKPSLVQSLVSSVRTEMVKRTAVLLALVALVTTFPASAGSYTDTEDLINELDRPSKYKTADLWEVARGWWISVYLIWDWRKGFPVAHVK